MQTIKMKLLNFMFIILIILCLNIVDNLCSETEPPLDEDYEASIGCPLPDLRFVRPKKIGSTTTESPYITFETTQIYLPDDITTADFEYIEHTVDELSSMESQSGSNQRQTRYTDFNPYEWNSGNAPGPELSDYHSSNTGQGHHNTNWNPRSEHKLRKNTGRHRLDRHNQGHKQSKREISDKYDEIYYIQSTDIVSQLHGNNINSFTAANATIADDLRRNKDIYNSEAMLLAHNNDSKSNDNDVINSTSLSKLQATIESNAFVNINNDDKIEDDGVASKIALQRTQTTNDNKITGNKTFASNSNREKNDDESNNETDNNTKNINSVDGNATNELHRVKRKSGKAAGALSRPKGGSDSGSKSTSRKKDGAGYDEEGQYPPHITEEEDSEEVEEEEEEESVNFDEVSEIRFPGEVGPQGQRRLCKIRCVKGKWVGPLCATTDQENPLKFKPLHKSCNLERIPAHLLLSYNNISVSTGWTVPHGQSLQARCKQLGMYKLMHEPRVLCLNGLWTPRLPACVSTTLLTNYSDDSPPSIRIKIDIGSGAFEPSGSLAVLPHSTIYLDCMFPRERGEPEWKWTSRHITYLTGWSNADDPKATKFRLTINDIQEKELVTFTCATPLRRLTNSIQIIVANSSCPEPPKPPPPLTLRFDGLFLGQRVRYFCPLGFTIEGASNSTCLASGNWSSPPPHCKPNQCPSLFLEDPNLSLTELNTSAWGKAVFNCSWGYRLTGPSNLECEPSGAWSGPVPRCRVIQCNQPLIPINGRIDGTSITTTHRKYAVGSLVTFSCNEGHLLVGEASIVCMENGLWSQSPPFCKPQCVYPGDPPNGLIAPLKFHYDPGDYLSVQCRDGFVEYAVTGPPERPHCLPDGNWSGPVPQCRNYAEV